MGPGGGQGRSSPGGRPARPARVQLPRSPRRRPLPPQHASRSPPVPPSNDCQALLLLWFIVEDHDTLFILSESVHFLGIGVLAFKLLTKRNCSGVRLRGSGGRRGGAGRRRSRAIPRRTNKTAQERRGGSVQVDRCRHAAAPPWRRAVAEDAGADGGVPGGAALLQLHDGVRHPHPARLCHAGGHGWARGAVLCGAWVWGAARQRAAACCCDCSHDCSCVQQIQSSKCKRGSGRAGQVPATLAAACPPRPPLFITPGLWRPPTWPPGGSGFVIYCLRGPLRESYQSDLDSLNPLVVRSAAPCGTLPVPTALPRCPCTPLVQLPSCPWEGAGRQRRQGPVPVWRAVGATRDSSASSRAPHQGLSPPSPRALHWVQVAAPCLLMAFIARPTTRHLFIFRVRPPGRLQRWLSTGRRAVEEGRGRRMGGAGAAPSAAGSIPGGGSALKGTVRHSEARRGTARSSPRLVVKAL